MGRRGLGKIGTAANAAKQALDNLLGIGGPPSTRSIKPNQIDIRKSPPTTSLQTIQQNTNPFTPANKGGNSRGVNIPLEKPDIRDRPRLQDKPENVRNPIFPQKKPPIIPLAPPLIPNIPSKPITEPVDNKKIPFPPKPPAPSPSSGDNELDPRKRPPGEGRRPPNEQTDPCNLSESNSSFIPGRVYVRFRDPRPVYASGYEPTPTQWYLFPYTGPSIYTADGQPKDIPEIRVLNEKPLDWLEPNSPPQEICPPPGVDPPLPPDKLEECPVSGCDCETVYKIVQTVVAKYTAETQNYVTSSTEIGMNFVNESHDFTRNLITTSKDEILTKIDNIKFPEIKKFDEEAFKKWMITLLADFGKRTLGYIEKLFKQQTYFLEDRMINYHQEITNQLGEIQSQVGSLIKFQQEITNYFESVLDDLATLRQLIIECCRKVETIDFSEILELIDTTSTRLNQDLTATITKTSGIVIGSLANQITISGNNTVTELRNTIANIENILSNNFGKRTQINRQNLKLVYDLLLEIYKCCTEGGINLNKDCCEDIKGVLSFSLCDTEEKVDPASEIAEDVASQVTGSLVNLVSSLIPGNIDDAALGALEGTIKKIVKGFVAVKIKPYVNTTQNARQIPYSGYAFKGIESQISALSQQLDLAVKEICSKSVECPDEEQYIFSGSLEFATCDENAPEISIWDTLVITTSNFVVSRIVSELVSKLFPFLKAEFDDKTLDAIVGNLEDTIKNELKSLFYRFLPLPKNERLKPYHGYNFEGIEKMLLALSDQINYVAEQLCEKVAASVPITQSAPIITKVVLPTESQIDGSTNFQCEDYEGPLAFPYQGSGIQGLSSQLVAIENGMNVILKQVCSVKKEVSSDNLNGAYSFRCGNDIKSFTYSGKGIIGLSSQLAALAQGVNAVLSKVCDSDSDINRNINETRNQIIDISNNNSQTTNQNIDNTRSQIIDISNSNSQAINQNIDNTRSQVINTVNKQTSNITETISEITSNITETISNVAETISEVINISQAISENLNYSSTIQSILENQLGNIVLTLNSYLENYSENTANTNSVLNQINALITNILNSVSVEIANTHSIDCDIEIGKQVKPKPLYVTNGAGLYIVDPVENLVKEVVRSYLNPQNVPFSGFLPNSLLTGIPANNIVPNTLLSGFPGYSAIYSANGLAANQLLELIEPAASVIQFDGLTFNNEEKIYLARSTPDRQTQYFKVMPDTGDIELIAESPNELTEGVGAMTKTFVGQTDREDPKVEYTYSLGVSNTREDFKLLRLNELDFSSLEIVLPQEINALLKSDPYTSGLPGSRQDYVLSITFDRDNNLYISSAQYDEDALGGYIKKRRLTRITNSGVGNISIIKDYPTIRSTGAEINEIDEGVIFDVLSFDALNHLWGLDVSSANSPILYRIENCTGEILSTTNPIGETGNEHILLKGNYYNFQFAPNNPEKKLHCLCDGDFKPELEIIYQQSQPQEYSYNGIGLKAIAQQVDQVFPILQQVVDKLCHPVKDEEYEKECLIIQCGNGYLEESVHEIIRYEGSGLKLLSSKLDAVIKQNQFLLNTTCQPSEEQGCVVLLPDERYAEFTVTKQLVLTFGTNYPKQTGSLWHVNIPMPIEDLDWCEHFENLSMKKGAVNGRLYWESSKLYSGSYFESEEEARRVLALFAALSTATPRQNNGVLDPRITKGAKTKRIPQNRVTRCVRAVVSDIDPLTGEPTNVQCYKPPRGGC